MARPKRQPISGRPAKVPAICRATTLRITPSRTTTPLAVRRRRLMMVLGVFTGLASSSAIAEGPVSTIRSNPFVAGPVTRTVWAAAAITPATIAPTAAEQPADGPAGAAGPSQAAVIIASVPVEIIPTGQAVHDHRDDAAEMQRPATVIRPQPEPRLHRTGRIVGLVPVGQSPPPGLMLHNEATVGAEQINQFTQPAPPPAAAPPTQFSFSDVESEPPTSYHPVVIDSSVGRQAIAACNEPAASIECQVPEAVTAPPIVPAVEPAIDQVAELPVELPVDQPAEPPTTKTVKPWFRPAVAVAAAPGRTASADPIRQVVRWVPKPDEASSMHEVENTSSMMVDDQSSGGGGSPSPAAPLVDSLTPGGVPRPIMIAAAPSQPSRPLATDAPPTPPQPAADLTIETGSPEPIVAAERALAAGAVKINEPDVSPAGRAFTRRRAAAAEPQLSEGVTPPVRLASQSSDRHLVNDPAVSVAPSKSPVTEPSPAVEQRPAAVKPALAPEVLPAVATTPRQRAMVGWSRSLGEQFPEAQLWLVDGEDGLVLHGVCPDRRMAVKVLRWLRAESLEPVVDRISLP